MQDNYKQGGTMKTPYDEEIERIWGTYKAAGPKAKAEEDRLCLLVLRAKAEGYRRAKEEDADLLEACKKLLDLVDYVEEASMTELYDATHAAYHAITRAMLQNDITKVG